MLEPTQKKHTFHWQLLLGVGLVLVAIVGRLLPHPPNATPVAGAALLAGAMMSRKAWALAVPVVALLLSDLLIGFYGWGVMLAVYAALLVPVLLGRWVPRGGGRYPMVAGLSFAGAVTFFVVSNLGVFLFTMHYAKTPAGLIACFAAAVPFFKYTMMGDVLWALGLFAVVDSLTYTARRGVGALLPQPMAA